MKQFTLNQYVLVEPTEYGVKEAYKNVGKNY